MDTRLFRIVAFEFVSILVLTLKVFSKVFNNEFYESKLDRTTVTGDNFNISERQICLIEIFEKKSDVIV